VVVWPPSKAQNLFFFFFLGLLRVASHPILAKGWLGPQQLFYFLFFIFNFLFFFLFLFLKIDAQNGIVLELGVGDVVLGIFGISSGLSEGIMGIQI
jgi:hypothetical protein